MYALTDVSGVRSSCETTERKLDLSWLTLSSSSLQIARARSLSRSCSFARSRCRTRSTRSRHIFDLETRRSPGAPSKNPTVKKPATAPFSSMPASSIFPPADSARRGTGPSGSAHAFSAPTTNPPASGSPSPQRPRKVVLLTEREWRGSAGTSPRPAHAFISKTSPPGLAIRRMAKSGARVLDDAADHRVEDIPARRVGENHRADGGHARDDALELRLPGGAGPRGPSPSGDAVARAEQPFADCADHRDLSSL